MLDTGPQGRGASEDDANQIVSGQRFRNHWFSGISNVQMSSKERYRVTFRATSLDFMASGNRDSIVLKLWAKVWFDSTKTNEATDSSDSGRKLRLNFFANHFPAYLVYKGRSSTLELNLVEAQIDLPFCDWEKM